jgi:hypothetical protein
MLCGSRPMFRTLPTCAPRWLACLAASQLCVGIASAQDPSERLRQPDEWHADEGSELRVPREWQARTQAKAENSRDSELVLPHGWPLTQTHADDWPPHATDAELWVPDPFARTRHRAPSRHTRKGVHVHASPLTPLR